MWLKEIISHAQNTITILGSIINIMEGGGVLYDCLLSMRTFTLIMNKIFIQAPQFMRKGGYHLDLDLLKHVFDRSHFVSFNQRVAFQPLELYK